jgi:hypothetical protein
MKPLCSYPWNYLLIGRHQYGPCCNYLIQETSRPSTRADIMALYHSPAMRELRRRLAAGDVAGTPCQACISLGRQQREFPFFELSRPGGDACLAPSAEAFAQGREAFDETPLVLNLLTSMRCNLRCIMCQPAKPDHDREGLDAAALLNALDEVGWERIREISVAGGEPLLTSDAMLVLERLAALGSRTLKLNLFTNGLLLHKRLDLLRRMGLLQLRLSVDSVGETYERIRVGGRWERIAENLRLTSELMHSRRHMAVELVSAVMRSSLPGMADLVRLADELDFDVNFAMCRDNYLEENIFTFPHLLRGLDWEGDFDRAEAACERSLPRRAITLETLRSLRTVLGRNRDRSFAAVSSPSVVARDGFLADALHDAFVGEDYVLFGTTTELLNALSQHRPPERLRAVYDFTSHAGDYLGVPLFPAEELRGHSGNVLVVCATQDEARYLGFLRESAPQATVRLTPFWDARAAGAMRELARGLAGRRLVGFGTGGAAARLLDDSPLGGLEFAAFSDNNAARWGGEFRGRPVLAPADIPQAAGDVLILSQAYAMQIAQGLRALHGRALTLHCPFPGVRG